MLKQAEPATPTFNVPSMPHWRGMSTRSPQPPSTRKPSRWPVSPPGPPKAAARPTPSAGDAISEILTCTFVTVHVGHAEVVSHLTTERIWRSSNFREGLERIRGSDLVSLSVVQPSWRTWPAGNREEIFTRHSESSGTGIEWKDPCLLTRPFCPEKKNM